MTATPRAHIAMFSIAAHGHVNPSLDVIRELVARGHRVSYAIPASFAGTVAATGAEPVIYTSVLPTADNPEDWGTELIDNIEPFLEDAVQASRSSPAPSRGRAGPRPARHHLLPCPRPRPPLGRAGRPALAQPGPLGGVCGGGRGPRDRRTEADRTGPGVLRALRGLAGRERPG